MGREKQNAKYGKCVIADQKPRRLFLIVFHHIFVLAGDRFLNASLHAFYDKRFMGKWRWPAVAIRIAAPLPHSRNIFIIYLRLFNESSSCRLVAASKIRRAGLVNARVCNVHRYWRSLVVVALVVAHGCNQFHTSCALQIEFRSAAEEANEME